MVRFIGFVRIFYTVNLILLGISIPILLSVEKGSAIHDHLPFNPFSLPNIGLYFMFGLLFLSRTLYSRSPKWLLLGLPTILLLYGFAGWILLMMTVFTPVD